MVSSTTVAAPRVENISKSHGRESVLKNSCCYLREGEIVGLAGLNRAGKSTTVKVIDRRPSES